MADDVLQSLDQDGKLPDTLDPTSFPDSALARAWVAAYGGTVNAYALEEGKAVAIGSWVGNAPITNPYTGEPKQSSIPPQWRAADSKSAFDIFNVRDNRTFTIDEKTGEKKWTEHPGRNGMEDQPNWNWTPEQPQAKPNRLN